MCCNTNYLRFQINWALSLSRFNIKECHMPWVIPYRKQIVVSWQPTAAGGSWFFAGGLKHILSHWCRDWDEIRFAFFKVGMIVWDSFFCEIFAVPNLNIFVWLYGQEQIAEGMVLNLPDWLRNLIREDTNAIISAASLGILLFKLRIRHIPNSDYTFRASSEQKSFNFCVGNLLRASNWHQGSGMSSECHVLLQEAVGGLIIFLDVLDIPQLNLAVIRSWGQNLQRLGVMNSPYWIKVAPNVILGFDHGLNTWWSSCIRAALDDGFCLTINHSWLRWLDWVLLFFFAGFFSFISRKHSFFKFLCIAESVAFKLILEVLLHFFLSFVIKGFDFFDLINIENIIISNLL